MARKSEDGTVDLVTGVNRLTPTSGPKLSPDYPNYMGSSVEKAVEEIPGRDCGGPGFLERQNTSERL